MRRLVVGLGLALMATGAGAGEPQETGHQEISKETIPNQTIPNQTIPNQIIPNQTIQRRIIARADVAGTDREMILVETTIPPGATSARHTHPGEEAFYVIDGATIQYPGEAAKAREAGAGGITAREVPHAGYTVVGDKSLKQVSVFVVDKGKPLSSPAK